jgi:hydroxymethylpyrimidine pyrophosphatase-like HAD family hydrolase
MTSQRRTKRPTLVAIDLDGTLLRDDKVISEFSLVTLRLLSQAGIHIAFVTGRRERIAMPVLAPVNFPAWAVLNNGPVGLELPGRRRVFTRYISAPVVQDVIACLRAIGRPPVVVIDPLQEGASLRPCLGAPGQHDKSSDISQALLPKGDEAGCSAAATENRKPKTENGATASAAADAAAGAPAHDLVMDRALLQIPLYQEYAARHAGYITITDDLAGHALLARAVAMFLCEPESEVSALRAHLTTALGDCIEHRALDNLEYIRDHRIVEMVEPGLTKWNGIEMLLEALALEDARVIAFGDDHNDLDMLTEAHMSFAPRNAIQAAKQAADDTIPSNNDDGVAVTLRKLFPDVFD